jgi:cytochrome c
MSSRKILPLVLLLALAACDMQNQPKLKPLDESDFFSDGRASRPRVPGTVAWGHLNDDELLVLGTVKGKPSDLFPFPVTEATLSRGRERFGIYCTPCHDRAGSGNGLVVRRGFPKPPSFHIDRLRQSPAGHFVNVMANGWGRMDSYGDRLTPEDRWAIAAWMRVLQRSQDTPVASIPAPERERLAQEPVHVSTEGALGDLSKW